MGDVSKLTAAQHEMQGAAEVPARYATHIMCMTKGCAQPCEADAAKTITQAYTCGCGVKEGDGSLRDCIQQVLVQALGRSEAAGCK